METANTKKKKSFYPIIFISVVFLIALYFVLAHTTDYFVFTEASYGSYFWPRVNWVFPHVVCGVVALLIGPFQFSERLRNTNLTVHRRMGYVYLTMVLIGGIAGGVLAMTSQVNLTYKMGLFGLAIAWLLTSGMALFFILKRKTEQHKEWMIRSYVVTFAFVIFRLFSDLLKHYEVTENADRLALMSWACWAIPLLFIEPILQFRNTFKKKRRSKRK